MFLQSERNFKEFFGENVIHVLHENNINFVKFLNHDMKIILFNVDDDHTQKTKRNARGCKYIESHTCGINIWSSVSNYIELNLEYWFLFK